MVKKMEHPVGPVCVIEGHDITLFDDILSMCRHLEEVDVKADLYRAYDSLGRLLKLEALEGKITVALAEKEPGHREELLRILQSYVKLKGVSIPEDRTGDLNFLFEQARVWAEYKIPKPVRWFYSLVRKIHGQSAK
jgi:hypothetical protein